MNSCLYQCRIMHDRHAPKRYRFEHDIFMFYLDLAEGQALNGVSWLFGFNKKRLYQFSYEDHVPGIREFIQENDPGLEVEHLHVLTNVRFFGYTFNPVSFYFSFDKDKKPNAVVVEIGNTFGELKLFYLGKDKEKSGHFKDRHCKFYYISPFTDLDNELDFRIGIPDENLNISINVLKKGEKFFYSGMQGSRQALTTKNLIVNTLKFPFVTLKVIFLIHWHAAVLHFVKGIAHHAKEENPQWQQGVYREWRKK